MPQVKFQSFLLHFESIRFVLQIPFELLKHTQMDFVYGILSITLYESDLNLKMYTKPKKI